jgi:two-component sensor histidine kinase
MIQAEALADTNRRKDEFLAMLSHELRNPLAPILNAVQLLQMEQANESPIQHQARTIIQRQVGQLAHLVDDLLEVSRITSGRIRLHQETIDARTVVESAIETVRPLIEQRKHQLTVSQPREPIWLHADSTRVEQVVVNLLNNAAKYTADGGHISLSVHQENKEAVIRVRDTGVGIALDLLPRIFELFTQGERSVDRSQGGLGIGLTLVRRLVELHGGKVEVDSVPGQGSEFVVRLPVLQRVTNRPSSTPVEPGAMALIPLRVLVVDDNADAADSGRNDPAAFRSRRTSRILRPRRIGDGGCIPAPRDPARYRTAGDKRVRSCATFTADPGTRGGAVGCRHGIRARRRPSPLSRGGIRSSPREADEREATAGDLGDILGASHLTAGNASRYMLCMAHHCFNVPSSITNIGAS